MRSLSHLNKYLWHYKWRLTFGVLFIIISNLFAIYSPKLIREAFDLVKEAITSYQNQEVNNLDLNLAAEIEWGFNLVGIDVTRFSNIQSMDDLVATIGFLAAALGILYLLVSIMKGIFLFFTRQTIIVTSRLIEYDLKNEVYDHYQDLDMAFYKRNNTGDLMNRISEDVSKVRMYLGPAIMYSINLVVLFILSLGAMISVNAELTLYVLAPLPVLSLIIYYVSTLINQRSEAVQRQQSALSTFVQEAFSGIRVLKAYTREAESRKAFEEECNLYKKRSLNLVKVDALFMPSIILLVGLSTIITIYIGGLKAIEGEITIGNIAEFVIYVNMLTWPFASIGWVTSLVQRAAASQTRINEFLHTSSTIINPSDDGSPIKGDIEFKNVQFVYPDSGIRALKDISFKIPSGKTFAITGRTGSGKSTIANLVCRNFDVTGGEIFIDGTDIREKNLDILRSSIGYVPQEVFLFSDTIFNNIAFGLDLDEDNTEKVHQAAKDACVYDNIIDFPKQFQTRLGERGITLSGGQKQRVSIARAIVKEPKILIFDDCLSAVDTETEERILQSLKRIMENKTTIIVSHRISSIKHADEIIVIDDGIIVERGTHDQLLAQQNVYADIYQQQLLEGQEDYPPLEQ